MCDGANVKWNDSVVTKVLLFSRLVDFCAYEIPEIEHLDFPDKVVCNE